MVCYLILNIRIIIFTEKCFKKISLFDSYTYTIGCCSYDGYDLIHDAVVALGHWSLHLGDLGISRVLLLDILLVIDGCWVANGCQHHLLIGI